MQMSRLADVQLQRFRENVAFRRLQPCSSASLFLLQYNNNNNNQ